MGPPDTDADADVLSEFQATLEAYRKAKWAERADVGEEALQRELAALERFLDQADELDWASPKLVAFRCEKVKILREILSVGGTA